MTGKYFHPVSTFICHRARLLGQYFHIFLHFWHFAEAGGRSQGAEASAAVYYVAGEVDWEIALKLPIVIVPPPTNCPFSASPFN